MCFFKGEDIAVDLGTASVLVYASKEGIILNEPSVVAIDNNTNRVIAVGTEAREMLGRTPGNIVAIRPLRDGVIAEYDVTEKMLKYFIGKAVGKKKFVKPRVMICIPSGVTSVEERAVKQAALAAGAKEAYLIEEPVAAALGAGIDISEPNGSIVVDIGGGSTEIAAISLGGITEAESIRIAGNQITYDIIDYMARQYNIRIGFRTAEEIKYKIGSVLMDLPADEAPEPMLVQGRNVSTSHPIEATITYKDVACCIDKTISQIENGIMKVLERVKPEIYTDLMRNGIWLAGGGALLRGIARRFSDRMNMTFHIAEDPLKAVARGTCKAIEDTEKYKYKFLMR